MTEKRNLFDELMDGIDAMAAEREAKLTLRTTELDDVQPLTIDAVTVRSTRERMKVSRAVFAHRLRVSARTLESWEQGRTVPNAQATALILMMRKYPDTFDRLKTLDPRAA